MRLSPPGACVAAVVVVTLCDVIRATRVSSLSFTIDSASVLISKQYVHQLTTAAASCNGKVLHLDKKMHN